MIFLQKIKSKYLTQPKLNICLRHFLFSIFIIVLIFRLFPKLENLNFWAEELQFYRLLKQYPFPEYFKNYFVTSVVTYYDFLSLIGAHIAHLLPIEYAPLGPRLFSFIIWIICFGFIFNISEKLLSHKTISLIALTFIFLFAPVSQEIFAQTMGLHFVVLFAGIFSLMAYIKWHRIKYLLISAMIAVLSPSGPVLAGLILFVFLIQRTNHLKYDIEILIILCMFTLILIHALLIYFYLNPLLFEYYGIKRQNFSVPNFKLISDIFAIKHFYLFFISQSYLNELSEYIITQFSNLNIIYFPVSLFMAIFVIKNFFSKKFQFDYILYLFFICNILFYLTFALKQDHSIRYMLNPYSGERYIWLSNVSLLTALVFYIDRLKKNHYFYMITIPIIISFLSIYDFHLRSFFTSGPSWKMQLTNNNNYIYSLPYLYCHSVWKTEKKDIQIPVIFSHKKDNQTQTISDYTHSIDKGMRLDAYAVNDDCSEQYLGYIDIMKNCKLQQFGDFPNLINFQCTYKNNKIHVSITNYQKRIKIFKNILTNEGNVKGSRLNPLYLDPAL